MKDFLKSLWFRLIALIRLAFIQIVLFPFYALYVVLTGHQKDIESAGVAAIILAILSFFMLPMYFAGSFRFIAYGLILGRQTDSFSDLCSEFD